MKFKSLKKTIKKITAVLVTTALAFSVAACGDDYDDYDDDDYGYYDDDDYDDDSAPGNNQHANYEFKAGESGTVISSSDGSINIDRVSRDSEQKMGTDSWTILVYLCGSDLESDGGAGTSDLYEMMEASYGDDVKVIVETGGADSWEVDIDANKIQRYQVADGEVYLVDEQPDANMGKKETLIDFINYGVANYPAKNMGLVFWNHGSGSINGVCFDEKNSNDSLSLKELDQALSTCYANMTDRFEFIGFDACLMSTIETANILVPYARYMYASQETEPGSGWNYTEILNYLGKNGNANGAELGKVVMDSYIATCTEAEDKAIATFAITDLSKIDALAKSFNNTANELYKSGEFESVIKGLRGADNFGGNNSNEGYTNMVDLREMLVNTSSYAPSAKETINLLDSAVIYNSNGKSHANAGGLSIYYPLSVQGSSEVKIFTEVCPSPWYMNIINKLLYGIETGDTDAYSSDTNEGFAENSDNIWEDDYDFVDVTTNEGENQNISESSSMELDDVYIDEDGRFTVILKDMDALYTATACVFLEDGEDYIYIGSIEDVNYDVSANAIIDNFDGLWPSFDDVLLPLELVDSSDTQSIYTCEILLNNEETNLRILSDNNGNTEVLGTWDGIDSETGMSPRGGRPLQKGDVIEPIYYFVSGDDYERYTIDSYTVNGEPVLSYTKLPAGVYYYSFELYDIYGNVYDSPMVSFEIDEDGNIYFDEEIMY